MDNMKDRMTAFGLLKNPKIGNVSEELKELNIAVPEINGNQVLVKIIASIIHVDDIALAQGTALGRFLGPKKINEETPYIMGSSYSGVVVGIGEGISKFKLGDEVIGIPHEKGEHGSWAEYRCVDEAYTRLKPAKLTHQEAVSALLAGCVAYGMTTYANFKEGSKCLVLGASGGIGSIVVQILKAKGAYVIALCSTRNIEVVKSLNADYIIDYTKDSFGEKLLSEKITLDYVFDSVGGKKIEKEAIKSLVNKGKFLTVCGPEKYIGSRKLSWLEVTSMFWYILQRSVLSKIKGPQYKFSEKYPSAVIDDMLELIIKHNIRVPFDRVIPFKHQELKDSLNVLAAHKATGRIVIDMTSKI